MDSKKIIAKLKSQRNPKNIAGMARFGISAKNTLGVSMPYLRSLAKEIRKEAKTDKKGAENRHKLAIMLWKSKIHEARILAALIDEPEMVGEKQMENWAKDFDSWDVCDHVCMNLFDKTEIAWQKAADWSRRKEEFVKRAGFALVAALAFHDKKADNKKFIEFFPHIKREAVDGRNFVRKAVNWALRQTGKRNKSLCVAALKTAREIQSKNPENKTAKWIASDAIRELEKKKF
ncbi:MAG: DNA alkylation repair protein [bacterium]|nr:DNA alkylation repair protein [bacterium]